MKAIISGGGTGGHIFPAISIAEQLKKVVPNIEILFVGAIGRMEMEKVPQAGYKIIGLPISGFQRKFSLKNITTLINIFKSLRQAKKIIKDFKPDIAIGVGGYASGPMLYAAQKKGIPTVIQEQNSYAGITNKILAKRVQKVCVAYDGMERFFKPKTIVKTGNPVRPQIQNIKCNKAEAYEHFGLNPDLKTILVVGGSLGARTVNQSVIASLDFIKENNIQVLWQTGKIYYEDAKQKAQGYNDVIVLDFIKQMDFAFTVADVIISRAGAGTISELCIVGKPCVFVPSPNVSEDHQTKNAQALVNKNAAIMIADNDSVNQLFVTSIALLNNETQMQELAKNIQSLAIPNSAELIVNQILDIATK
jgi:UDP-N-acetylglucosamine--N-acetylmuramyl-(pentapeptide) pyrophosphoryl-undecaprenol N-acetylglucosamine transferase